MSEQVNPVPVEETDSSSGLLLSVEPLKESAKLHATDTVDGGADSDVTGADTDTTDATDDTDASDSDGTDASDADGSDVVDKVKDALGMDSDSDSDGTDATVDADSTDAR